MFHTLYQVAANYCPERTRRLPIANSLSVYDYQAIFADEFPHTVAIRIPSPTPAGFYAARMDWLVENCGPHMDGYCVTQEGVYYAYWTNGGWAAYSLSAFETTYYFADPDVAFAFKMRWV